LDGVTVMLAGAPVGVSGSTSQTTSGGAATFSNVSVPQLASGETLTAKVQLNPSAGFLMAGTLPFKVVAAPAITLPKPGSKLNGATVVFQWYGGAPFNLYKFSLGTTGPGSSDLYVSSPTASTLVTISKVPLKGKTVYARL